MEPVLAIVHFLLIFVTVALVVGEFLLLRVELTGPILKLLSRLDLLFGVFALLVVASGLARVFLGDVPPATWATSHAFWTKMILFGAVGALSVVPTLKYLAWGKAFAADGSLPSLEQKKKVGLFVHLELALLLLMPVMAVLMAESVEE